ncbi:MAG: hypothetical protein RLZZ435_464, partial [Cyanobacteriota bacterium]
PTLTTKRWTGKVEETYTYRYLNGVPLKDGEDALLANWCEVTVSRPDGKVIYRARLQLTPNHNDRSTGWTHCQFSGSPIAEGG